MIRGLLTDEEWSFFEPFMVSASPLGGRPARDHRRVLDAIFWIARTGAPWRDLPAELGNWNSVFRQGSQEPDQQSRPNSPLVLRRANWDASARY